LPENAPVLADDELAEAAREFMREYGAVVPGSSSGDFSSFPVKGNLGWLVRYANDGFFNLVRARDCPERPHEVTIGLAGRARRARDAAELDIVHIENPGGERPPKGRLQPTSAGKKLVR
jgi:hypothetical protein